MWYTIMVTTWIGESHLLKWQKSSIAQNYIELPHFIMRHRQAVRQGTLTPPSQVRLLLAQLDKSPHGCLKNQVSMRGFAFAACLQAIRKSLQKRPCVTPSRCSTGAFVGSLALVCAARLGSNGSPGSGWSLRRLTSALRRNWRW